MDENLQLHKQNEENCFLNYHEIPWAVSEINITPVQQEAFNHYKKNTMSVELLKDDNLQKVNFRVKNKVYVCVHAYKSSKTKLQNQLLEDSFSKAKFNHTSQ